MMYAVSQQVVVNLRSEASLWGPSRRLVHIDLPGGGRSQRGSDRSQIRVGLQLFDGSGQVDRFVH